MFYGLTHKTHAVDMARVVCDVLGHGKNKKAVHMVVETAYQETLLGEYRDVTDYSAGFGLCQHDLISFDDVKKRTRLRHKVAVKKHFDVNINQVQHRELEHSPLLSIVFCRLHYKLIKEEIPVDVGGRAVYWKKYYNTSLGKGKTHEYIEKALEIRGLLK